MGNRVIGVVVLVVLCLAVVCLASAVVSASHQIPSPAQAAAMTNADVVNMVRAGLSEDVIRRAIRQAAARSFDLGPTGLIDLKKAGVPDSVIAVMQGAGSPADDRVAGGSAAARPAPIPTRKLSADELREAATYGRRWNSADQFLDDGLKDHRVKFSGAFAMDGTSKYATFLTDWTTVAAAAAAAKKEHRELSDGDLQAIPVSGLLHAILEVHARGLLNTGPATGRFANGRVQLLLKFSDGTVQPVESPLVTERNGPYFPMWTYMVNTYGSLGWSILVAPGAITKKIVLDFAYPPLNDRQVRGKASVVLIDADGKEYKSDFDFSKLHW
jgi:hypothetical protein